MSQERETPRTDERVRERRHAQINGTDYVSADFARKLERELAASQAEAQRLQKLHDLNWAQKECAICGTAMTSAGIDNAERAEKAEAERDAALKSADDADTDKLRAIGLYDSCAEDRAKLQARCRELENEIKQLNKDLDAEEAEHAEHIAQAKFELSRLEADARRYRWLRDCRPHEREWWSGLDAGDWDAAIDAALAAEEGV